MAKPNLLLCFDAFGTLFRPRQPVAKQYANVARQCGLGGLTDHQVESSLKVAIKRELKENPNYGKSTGLGATAWWTKVIHSTFTPLLPSNGSSSSSSSLPENLAPTLLHRFASSEAYSAEPHLKKSLAKLRRDQNHFDQVVIGVITNSDDRVPDILTSLGLDVSPLRYGAVDTGKEGFGEEGSNYDIDFHCMSYDVGFEKPDKRIFESAEHMLSQVLLRRGGGGRGRNGLSSSDDNDNDTWWKVYVGDEYAKDVVGSSEAGWCPVLLGSDDGVDAKETSATRRISNIDISSVLDSDPEPITVLLRKDCAARVSTVADLASWLCK